MPTLARIVRGRAAIAFLHFLFGSECSSNAFLVQKSVPSDCDHVFVEIDAK